MLIQECPRNPCRDGYEDATSISIRECATYFYERANQHCPGSPFKAEKCSKKCSRSYQKSVEKAREQLWESDEALNEMDMALEQAMHTQHLDNDHVSKFFEDYETADESARIFFRHTSRQLTWAQFETFYTLGQHYGDFKNSIVGP